MNKLITKLKSPVVLGSIAVLIFFILKTYNVWAFIGLTQESGAQFWQLILSVLVAFGILNNPDDKTKF